jgi:hypothetical protein
MSQILTVEHVTELALQFTKKYYAFAFPLSVKKTLFHWIVDLDISYYRPKYMRVWIVRETGIVEDFIVTPGQLL